MNKAILAFAVIWLCIVFLTPDAVGFRDSPELVIAARYLDVAHPPGYPLYSQLANIFCNLGFSSAAWRVNLFSGFAALCSLALIYLIARELLSQLKLKNQAWLSLALLAICPIFLRQIQIQEAYLLHLCISLLLIYMWLVFERTADQRLLLLSAFICGLSLGNHVSSVFLIAFGLILLVLKGRKVLLLSVCAGLMGTAVFLYLPVRAQQPLALNTGAVVTLERFVMLVSDARDRALKPVRPQQASRVVKVGAYNDLIRLNKEVGSLILVVSLYGMLIVFKSKPFLGFGLSFLAVSNWWFFQSWQSDPWLILCAVLILFATVACARLPWRIAAPIIFVCLLWQTREQMQQIAYAAQQPSAQSALSKLELEQAPYAALYLTESSWFPWRYLTSVEGYRDDLVLVYQPRLLFPHYFEPFSIGTSTGEIFDSVDGLMPETTANQANFSNLGRLLQTCSKYSQTLIEPSLVIETFLSEVIQLTAAGDARVRAGELTRVDPAYFAVRSSLYNDWRYKSQYLKGQGLLDARQYIESKLINEASLLDMLSHKDKALKLYQSWCMPREVCSPVALHNLVLYTQQLSGSQLAQQELTEALQIYPNSQTLNRLIK